MKMKILLSLTLLVGVTLADPGWNSDAATDTKVSVSGLHYEQHSASVSAARKSVEDRLSHLGASANRVDSSGTAIVDCTACKTRHHSHHKSDADTYGVGVGYVGYTPETDAGSSNYQYGRSSHSEASESGSVAGSPYYRVSPVSSSSQSNLAHSVSRTQGGPIVIPVVGGASESYAEQSHLERVSKVNAAPVIVSPSGSEKYESHSEHVSRTQAAHLPAYPITSGSERHASQSEHISQIDSQAPIGFDQHATGHYSQIEEADLQSQVPVFSHGGSSRYSAHSERHKTQQAVPLPVYSQAGGSERYSSHTEHQKTQSVPLPVYTHGGGSERYSAHSEHQKTESVPLPVYTHGGGSERYSAHSEHHKTQQSVPVPVYTPSGGSERYVSHSERFSERKTAPVAPVYVPSGGSERYVSTARRMSELNAAPIVPVYAPIGSDRFASHSQHLSEVRATPIAPVYTPSGKTERYSSYSERVSQTQQPVPVPVYRPSGGTQRYTAHSERISETKAAPPVYIQPASASSSRFSAHESSATNQAGGYYPVIPVGGGSSSHFAAESAHQTSGLTGHFPGRLGTGHLAGHGSLHLGVGTNHLSEGTSPELQSYMSESERLAKLQAKNIHTGGIRSGSTVLDSEFSSSAATGQALGAHAGTGTGGYQKSKSWEKSSKWASGTQFDTDGKPKNYNLLSTAESEQHNINGNQAGYKAATTTLDDDGKVSTYSIHTP